MNTVGGIVFLVKSLMMNNDSNRGSELGKDHLSLWLIIEKDKALSFLKYIINVHIKHKLKCVALGILNKLNSQMCRSRNPK